jgi:hypothetical protein
MAVRVVLLGVCSGLAGASARRLGSTPRSAPTALKPRKRIRQSGLRKCRDLGIACRFQKFVDVFLAHTEPVKPDLDPFHREREQHQQYWEQHDRESLHTG